MSEHDIRLANTRAFAWIPSQEVVEDANSTRFARAHGLDGFEALLERSLEDPAWFWDAVVRYLGLPFSRPYERILDMTDGIEWARWFVGGELNLTHACVDRWVEAGRGDHDAIRFEDETGASAVWSFADLAAASARAADGLARLGVGKGDRVALLLPYTPEAVATWYGIVRLGAIAVPIFSGFAVPAIATRLVDSGARVVVTAEAASRRGRRLPIREGVLEAAASAPSVEHVVVWEDLVRGAADGRPPLQVEAEHPLLIAYTSGTTGRPKGAVHVHGGFLVKHAAEVWFQADLKDGDAVFWLSDMGWIMAPWAFVGAHACGQTLVLYDGAPDHPGPDRLWQLVERQRVTFMGVSPSLIRALAPHGAGLAHRYDLTSLRLFGSAGEPWNPEPYRWLAEEVGGGTRPIINLSGGTEVASSFLSCDVSLPIKPCSLGRPALGMDIAVYDEDGRPVVGEVGELVCRQPWPSMTRGIWGDDERYLESYWRRWPGVWVHGDWASVDEDGAWYLHGRSDDALNVAGKRIGSAEYESALVADPAVLEACAIGMPHPLKGEVAWCFVTLAPGAQDGPELIAGLARRIEQELGKAFRAERIVVTDALPKTRSAKIVRRAVRAVALDADPGDVSTLEDPAALDAIRDAVARSR